MKEEYKDIKGYEGLYQISNLGKVKSIGRKVICKDGKNKYVNEHLVSPGNNGTGYLFVYLWKNNKSKRFYIHRLVANHFLNNFNNYDKVNHKDFNRKNNCVDNLEWCNDFQNMAHCNGSKVYVIKEDKKTIIETFNSMADAGRVIDKNKEYVRYRCKTNKLTYSDYYNEFVYFSLTNIVNDIKSKNKLKFNF